MNSEVNVVIEKIKNEKDIFKIARLLNFLIKDKQIRVIELAKIFGWKSSYISNVTRLLKLPEIIIDGYYSNNISVSHLIIISRLKNIEDMSKVYEQVLTESLSVLKTESVVRDNLYSIKTDDDKIPKYTLEKITQNFKNINPDLKVKIIQTRIRTKVVLQLEGGTKKTNLFLKILAG